MKRAPREFPSWVAVPLLILGTGGGYLVYERVKDARESAPSSADAKFDAIFDREVYDRPTRKTPGVRLVADLMELPPERRQAAVETLIPQMSSPSVDSVAAMTPLLSRESRWRLSDGLSAAIQSGDLSMARTMLEGGALNPAPRGAKRGFFPPPVYWAIRARSVDAMRLLVRWGVDPDARIEMRGEEIREMLAWRPKGPKEQRPGVDAVTGAAPGHDRATAPRLNPDEVRKMSMRELANLTGDRLVIQALGDRK